MQLHSSTRRWPRHHVDLPVRIVTHNGLNTLVAGRGTQLSEGGMALYVAIAMQPGDLTEIELPTPRHTRMQGVVRDLAGDCVGLEFVTPPLTEDTVIANLRGSSVELVRAAVSVFDKIRAAENGVAVSGLLAEILARQGHAEEARKAEQRVAALSEELEDVRSVLRETRLQIQRLLTDTSVPGPLVLVPKHSQPNNRD
jgi:hypothetical protein